MQFDWNIGNEVSGNVWELVVCVITAARVRALSTRRSYVFDKDNLLWSMGTMHAASCAGI